MSHCPSHFRVSSLTSEAQDHIQRELKRRKISLREYFQLLIDIDIKFYQSNGESKWEVEQKMSQVLDQLNFMEENIDRQFRTLRATGVSVSGGGIVQQTESEPEEETIGVAISKAKPQIKQENLETIDEDFDTDF